jgi:VanZ family protein
MIRKDKIEFFLKYYLPVFALMGLIFYFSSLEGDVLTQGADKSIWFYIERKGAHVFEYAVLTVLIARIILAKSDIKKLVHKLILSGGLTLMYAFSDEIHQLFVVGREGKISDVGIDTIGIIIASIVIYGFYRNKNLYK